MWTPVQAGGRLEKRTGTDAVHVHSAAVFVAKRQPLEARQVIFEVFALEVLHHQKGPVLGRLTVIVDVDEAGVPVIPGYDGANQDPEVLAKEALNVGFPVLLKASAGGGGKGMRVVNTEAHLHNAMQLTKQEAANAFGDDTVYLEKYLENPRHVEVQVVGSHTNASTDSRSGAAFRAWAKRMRRAARRLPVRT